MNKCCGQKPTGETGCHSTSVSTPEMQDCIASKFETSCSTMSENKNRNGLPLTCSSGGVAETLDEERGECPVLIPSWISWFDSMVDHCYDYAEKAHANGEPIVGILCEYTPREIIMAAGGIPVCLCGGSAEMIPAAEEDLPSNLCPLIKSTYGYHKEKANPFLEWASLIVAETTCDGKKKMYELMSETREMHVLELPQKPDDKDAFEHWFCEIRKLKDALEKRFNTTVTDQKLTTAIKSMNLERGLKKEISYLMQSDAPPLTGLQLLHLNSIISAMPSVLDQYISIIDKLKNMKDESNKGKKRVLLTGVPLVHGAEQIVSLIENSGGLVVAMENCSGLKPIMNNVVEDSPDPLRAVAEHYFYNIPCSVMTKNDRRLDSIKEIAKDFSVDCIIDLVWQACLTYDVEAVRVKKLAEDELNLPYLKITTDYSPSDSARIATRIEALFETV